MRSTLPPGPFEGEALLDRDGERVGTITDLVTVGAHVSAFRVKLDADGREIEVPRDWFLNTTREGVQLVKDRHAIEQADAA